MNKLTGAFVVVIIALMMVFGTLKAKAVYEACGWKGFFVECRIEARK